MQPYKIGTFTKSWLLFHSALRGISLDKEVLMLPILGFFFTLAALLPFGIAFAINPHSLLFSSSNTAEANSFAFTTSGTALLFIGGLATSIIGTCVTSAVVYAALERFKGNDPTIKSSLAAVKARFVPVALFGLISWTVGQIISIIIERVPILGGLIVGWLLGTAWNVASFFSLPVILDSKKPVYPKQAISESTKLVKKVWGESLVLSASIGVVGLLLTVTYIALAGILFTIVGFSSSKVIVSSIFVAILGFIALTILLSVASAYVKAAIYHFATTNVSPRTFNTQVLQQSFTVKKARKIFG